MTFYKIYGQNEWDGMVLIDTVYTDRVDYADLVVEMYKEEFTESWVIWHEKSDDEVTDNQVVEERMLV
jgi:hypothetical protein